ncbi:MAG: helix-turn-helix domain-containing protein [Candidatus Korarchaeota archaeon]|nr:helix-turn-helix domain-containing protein [Thermoproteota archaeon]MCR8463438.1 helix-turn-helix domain-containing protein [Thermoproteota archaeon]MCR8471228.1 helix-turn-helix domain-containing protein [Thermoproteota archaeon]MCR8471921.1 helix-turn-helix domain-containing protein [Thermoproteota archaeon]MCR8488499.1 helix-turn-helix domain-containing protein [Thermoproteota archaeon]
MKDEIDVFKALGNPIRRRILMYIAKNRAVSYKDLTKIVPKAGALYHHLRLLGDLIEQDENKMYRLTPKGLKVYEFLLSEFFIPEDKTVAQKLLTPRIYLEMIEGPIAYLLVAVLLTSSFLWLLTKNLVVFFIVPIPVRIPDFLAPIMVMLNLMFCVSIEKSLIRSFFGRRVKTFELLSKSAPAFLIINLYPVVFLLNNHMLTFAFHLIAQIMGMLLSMSAISVVARLPLRSSLIIALILHYAAILILFVSLGGLTLSATIGLSF